MNLIVPKENNSLGMSSKSRGTVCSVQSDLATFAMVAKALEAWKIGKVHDQQQEPIVRVLPKVLIQST